jgi:hypothetical protein
MTFLTFNLMVKIHLWFIASQETNPSDSGLSYAATVSLFPGLAGRGWYGLAIRDDQSRQYTAVVLRRILIVVSVMVSAAGADVTGPAPI